MFVRRIIIILAIVLAVAGFLGWKFFGNKQNKVQYQTAKVQRGTLVVSVAASGQALTTGRLPILSQASGQVKEVFVKNGDQVTAGQKILSIILDPVASQKNTAAWSNYLSAKATFYSLQSTMFTKWKTYLDLATNSPYQNADQTANEANRTAAVFHVAQDDWLKAEADYNNQQAVVNAAWQSYQQTSPDLVAPVAGTVTDLTYAPGMLINSAVSSGIAQSQTIASILTPSTLTITVNLSEADVNKVSQENKATVTFDALPGKTFTGKVAGINKTGVVTSGVTNFPATIQLDTTPPEVLPNMSASANIIVATKNDVLLAPSEAVQNKKVKILNNNQLQSISVETGLSSDTQTEIISGVDEGEEIVTGTTTNASTPTGTSPFSTFRLGGNIGGGGGGANRGGGR